MKKLVLLLTLISASCFSIDNKLGYFPNDKTVFDQSEKEITCIVTKKIKIQKCPDNILDIIIQKAKIKYRHDEKAQKLEIEADIEGYFLMKELKENIYSDKDNVFYMTLLLLGDNNIDNYYSQYQIMIKHIAVYPILQNLKKALKKDVIGEAFVKKAQEKFPYDYEAQFRMLFKDASNYGSNNKYEM